QRLSCPCTYSATALSTRIMRAARQALTRFSILFFFFKQKTAYEIGLGIPAEPLFRSLKRRGCLTVPRLTLMSLIKMMLVMVSVAAISKTFGLLRFLLRLSFLAK